MKRSGFTMIELIFVIVILGILAAVAVPKLTSTRDDAKAAKVSANLVVFMKELNGYYLRKGAFGAATTLADITNVPFGTDATPTATTQVISGQQLVLTDGAKQCLTVTPGSLALGTDGTVTIAKGPDSATTICKIIVENAFKAGFVSDENGSAKTTTF